MFANWNLIIPPDKDRSRPNYSPAIKKARISSVTFPRCLSLTTLTPPSAPQPPDLDTLSAIFSTIKRPTDFTPAHLQQLNVSYSYDLPLSSVIPVKYHPDENDEKAVFAQRKNEVGVENQDAYDFIARRRKDIKIGNFYKFFQTSEMVEMLLSADPDAKSATASSSSSSSAPEVTSPPGAPERHHHHHGESNPAARSSARYREELLRHFVDPIAWGFDMRIYPPRYPPRLVTRRSLFSAKIDIFLHQQPPTMQERKEGIVIGPVLALQTRNEDKFTETDDVMDAVHELAALLTLSQERQRTGANKKIQYRAVGKDRGVGGDDVFLISSIHHHLALSHVFLTDAFSKFIRTGELPDEQYIKANPQWCCCRIGRTKWYSLLDPEGRMDALKAVLSLLTWLKRDDTP
ncbi:hypothetical protein H072_3685 [Dactylellina haptotyla CBS 200.50]|uniref:Uncharacterized protein n=1 Tax=Dactylellina haptotyla (strain CBS 200.50) TaxID=1284197 RepID=S8BSD7_DACHA|nr:hypothetical protein H072_3685 [Dactylellina haptotyla CBS 200.50]